MILTLNSRGHLTLGRLRSLGWYPTACVPQRVSGVFPFLFPCEFLYVFVRCIVRSLSPFLSFNLLLLTSPGFRISYEWAPFCVLIPVCSLRVTPCSSVVRGYIALSFAFAFHPSSPTRRPTRRHFPPSPVALWVTLWRAETGNESESNMARTWRRKLRFEGNYKLIFTPKLRLRRHMCCQ